jgi:Dullard-like phosphatase family protein
MGYDYNNLKEQHHE